MPQHELWNSTNDQIVNGLLTSANCPECQGAGEVTVNRLEVEGDNLVEKQVTEPCTCVTTPGNLLAEAGIPEGRFSSATLAELDWEAIEPVEAIATIRDYAQNLTTFVEHGIGLTLAGKVGTGKTHIAIALVRLACGLGIPSAFASMGNILTSLRMTYEGSRNGHEAEIMDRLAEIPLLAIDDIGTEKTTEWVRDRVYFVINRRYLAQLPTIVTTNLTPGELADRLGERTVSRIWGTSITVSLTGEDYRKVARLKILASLK